MQSVVKPVIIKLQVLDLPVKTEHSRLMSNLLFGFLLGYCRPVIGPQALQENDTLVLANQSALYIRYQSKSKFIITVPAQ